MEYYVVIESNLVEEYRRHKNNYDKLLIGINMLFHECAMNIPHFMNASYTL